MTRLRSILEIAALILTIVVCAGMLLVVGRNLRNDRTPPQGAQAGGSHVSNYSLPTSPTSLDGAQIEGNRAAKIAVIEYSDFQCPFCARFAQNTFPEFEKEYVRTGRVLFAFRQFPLESLHHYALKAAETTECAGEQGQFWKMHSLTFADQSHLDDESLHDHAVKAGLNVLELEACLSGDAAAKVQADQRTGKTLLVTGTPTFFIGAIQPDGRVKIFKRISGSVPLDQFKAALDTIASSTGPQARKSN